MKIVPLKSLVGIGEQRMDSACKVKQFKCHCPWISPLKPSLTESTLQTNQTEHNKQQIIQNIKGPKMSSVENIYRQFLNVLSGALLQEMSREFYTNLYTNLYSVLAREIKLNTWHF